MRYQKMPVVKDYPVLSVPSKRKYYVC